MKFYSLDGKGVSDPLPLISLTLLLREIFFDWQVTFKLGFTQKHFT